MSEKVKNAKIQIYVPPEVAAAWRRCAANEGVNLSDWVSNKVLEARLITTSLKNLHDKVDTLLESK